MSEYSPENWKTPSVEATVGGYVLHLSYMNTFIVTFENYYQHEDDRLNNADMNHVVHDADPDDPDVDEYMIYNSPDLIEHLDDLCYPHHRFPYPRPIHIEKFIEFNVGRLDEEPR